MRYLLVGLLAFATLPTSLSGQEPLLKSGSRLSQAPDLGLNAPDAYPQRFRYGARAWQTIEFYPAKTAAPAPLVIAFSNDADGWPRYRLNESGISLAIVPQKETVPTARKTIDNYIEAIAYLYRETSKLNFDRSRIALFGSGNGGSMAVLLGTDPVLTARAGVPFDAVRAVISFGGEDFDVLRRMKGSPYLRSLCRRYYGGDEAELSAFSPASHLQLPNAPAFLLLAGEGDAAGIEESRSIAEKLLAAGSSAEFATVPDKREGVRRTYFLGEPGGAAWEIMPFLEAAFKEAR